MKGSIEFTDEEAAFVQKWHSIACAKVSGLPIVNEKDFLLALVEDYAYRHERGLLPTLHSAFEQAQRSMLSGDGSQ